MKERISVWQLSTLIYATIIPTAILVVPSVVMAHSKQDAWISILAATILGTGIAWLTGSLAKRVSGQFSFLGWLSRRLGKWAAVIVGLGLTSYYISISATILQEFTNILSDQILFETPDWVIMVIILSVCGYAVYGGIEVIARVNGVVTTISIITYCISLTLFFNLIEPHQLMPIMDTPLPHVAYGGLLPLGWLSEVALVLLLAPYLHSKKGIVKAAVGGTVAAGFHLTLTVALCLILFGPIMPQQFRYPTFSMIEIIKLGTTLERLDILFVSFWVCTIYIKMALFLFGAFHCLTETFVIKPSKPVLLGLSLVIMMTAFVSFHDETAFDNQMQHVTPYELLGFNVVLPLLLAAALLVRKKAPRKRRS
ncbi:endospore germination permease [Paenibacillus sp. YN15]|uniref:GerAB/ArcD/ProY family transporter n=1 Tax=Paenibacillus sp. YN15 TaxID=1742774 RepID=UPI000DCDB3F1|nr:endospore germination permease [Paenibacillus sp. YN15]RAV06483.1 hypothetical protein DQG13_01210 [Paenibacillus sp. YN15]